MNPKIDGYYISEGKKFEEWHAGHKSEVYIYSFLKFNSDHFVETKADEKSYNFVKFLKSHSSELLIKDSSIAFGNYIIENNNKILLHYKLLNCWDMNFELDIISSNILSDKDGRKFTYIPVDDPEFENLPL